MRRLIVLPFLALPAACASPQPAQPAAQVAPVTLTAAQTATVHAGLRRGLKDPESARFGDYRAGRDGETIMVCGYINARNSYGGYTGMKPYMGGLAGGRFVVIDIAGDDSGEIAIHQVCAQRGLPLRSQ